MALTPRRWLALLAVACLGLGVLLLPPRGTGALGVSRLLGIGYWREPDFTGDSLRFRRYHLSQAIRRTEVRLAAVRLRDSLVEPVTEARGVLSVASFPGVAPGLTARARALAEELEPRLGEVGRSRVRIILVLQQEKRDWFGSTLLFLPGSVAEDACVVAVKKKELAPGELRELISPCVFYAVFGVPGDSIAGWLSRRGYDVARDHAWWSPAVFPPAGSVDVSWWSSRLLAAVFNGEWPEWLDLERSACQGGKAAACARTLLVPRFSPFPFQVGDRIYTLLPPSLSRRYEAVNPARDGMLAELVREFGKDRFAAFWNSAKPLEAAFEDAFGEPLPAWALRWTQRRLGVTYSGPVVRWGGVLGWIAFAGLAVFVTAAAASRRQVS